MSAQIIPINRWIYQKFCAVCDEPWENIASCDMCLRSENLYDERWLLYGTAGKIERFTNGPYYGSWPGGRTGAMIDFEWCKREVEKAVLTQ